MTQGFYVREKVVPHPTVSVAVFLVIEKAIGCAWSRLRDRSIPEFDLTTADEDTVTLKLYEILYDEVFNEGVVQGFDSQLFNSFGRESKVRNFDGKFPDKMPDLVVTLVNREVFRRSQDGLFIECKPVGRSHSVGKHYCDKGIIRYINGDYAWAMTSALMLGYVSTGYSLEKLREALEVRKDKLGTRIMPVPCRRSKSTKISECIHVTSHSRKFTYVETGENAGEIRIRHLWLMRD